MAGGEGAAAATAKGRAIPIQSHNSFHTNDLITIRQTGGEGGRDGVRLVVHEQVTRSLDNVSVEFQLFI